MIQQIVPSPSGDSNDKGKRQSRDEISHIAWHPAFVEAIQLELDDYRDFLEFHPEYQLTAEPLRIDCVVIKKTKDVVIRKNIAAIFKEVNLMEYKSPDDYVSVENFYKVYGYACLYASLEKIPISNLTVSFVVSHVPEKLLEHVENIRGYTVEINNPGIYIIKGDILPIQIIDNRQLSADENLWLNCLSNRLDPVEVNKIGDEAARQEKTAKIQAYLSVIAKANINALREAIKMSEETLTLEQVFEEAGWIAKWEAKGLARGMEKGMAEGIASGKEAEALTIAQNMVNAGFPLETVVSMTKLDPEKVKTLYRP
jgi:hypothetical protein